MLNNFIGGGQVFLHKIRMFQQVFTRTVSVAFLLGIVASVGMHNGELKELDWSAFYSYRISDEADYDKRALYYWAKLYTEQLEVAEDYSTLALKSHWHSYTEFYLYSRSR